MHRMSEHEAAELGVAHEALRRFGSQHAHALSRGEEKLLGELMLVMQQRCAERYRGRT